MRSESGTDWAVLVVALVIAGCGSPTPSAPSAPPSARPAVRLPLVPTASSEAFAWNMTVSGVQVARFELAVSPVGDALRIVSRANLTGAARFFKVGGAQAGSIVSRSTGASERSRIELFVQGQFERADLFFDAGGVRGIVGDEVRTRAFEWPTVANLVPLSSDAFLLALRAWRPTSGERALAVVAAVESVWLVELEAEEPRAIDGPLGRRAHRLAGSATRLSASGAPDSSYEPRRLAVYISDDADALPLRVETSIGAVAVVVELTDWLRR